MVLRAHREYRHLRGHQPRPDDRCPLLAGGADRPCDGARVRAAGRLPVAADGSPDEAGDQAQEEPFRPARHGPGLRARAAGAAQPGNGGTPGVGDPVGNRIDPADQTRAVAEAVGGEGLRWDPHRHRDPGPHSCTDRWGHRGQDRPGRPARGHRAGRDEHRPGHLPDRDAGPGGGDRRLRRENPGDPGSGGPDPRGPGAGAALATR